MPRAASKAPYPAGIVALAACGLLLLAATARAQPDLDDAGPGLGVTGLEGAPQAPAPFPDLDPQLVAAWQALRDLELPYVAAEAPTWKPLTAEEVAAREATRIEEEKRAERERRRKERRRKPKARKPAEPKPALQEEGIPGQQAPDWGPPPTSWGIWASLLEAGAAAGAMPEELRPWAELLQLYGNHTLGRASLAGALQAWQRRWAGHPALEIGQALEWWLSAEARRMWPLRIALALPLSGPLKQAGEIVLAGLQAAYYRARALDGFAPRLLVLDSASLTVADLASRAAAERVDFLIGPLEATRVSALMDEIRATASLSKVLALNYAATADGAPVLEGFWQIGLPVEQEVPILAEYAKGQGYKRGGGLLVESNWGLRAGDSFEKAWRETGGDWVGTESISPRSDFTAFGRRLLLLDESERRIRALRRTLGVEFEAEPRARGDLDFLYMAASAKEGRRLRAALNFNRGRSIPLLAASSIFRFDASDDVYDLAGVFFADIPWLARGPAAYGMRQVSQYPGSRHRLFALGVDAFLLSQRLTSLQPHSQLPVLGATGVIWMGEGERLERRPYGLSILDPRRGPEIVQP